MTDQTLIMFRRFKAETADDTAAAILTLAAVLTDQQSEPLTVKQAAKRLGVSEDVIYQKCSAGELKHRRIGRAIRIDPADLSAA